MRTPFDSYQTSLLGKSNGFTGFMHFFVIAHLVGLVLKMIDLEELVICSYGSFVVQLGSVGLANLFNEIRSL